MKKEEFYYISADAETQIHACRWLPEGKPKAILQIVHGVTEHILRYEELATYMTEKGIMVIGNDHLGHGKSIKEETHLMYFGPTGSWNWVVEDMKMCIEMTKKEFSDIPYFVLGFSLGSFVLRTYLIKYPKEIDGAIIVGTGQTSHIAILLAKYMANKEIQKVGENNSSPTIRKLTFETYNKKFTPNKTDYDWLCRSEKALAEYINDPLRGDNMSTGLFREMLYGMEYTAKQNNIGKMNKDIPILLLSGEKDSVGDNGKGVKKFYKCLKKAEVANVEMKLYSGLRHDILHEDCREEIYEQICEWIEKL